MESLEKYVPFIDFLLKIDQQKYIKFINIRKWIKMKKKNYPLSNLNKIEQSIITQYKNLLIENNVQIPDIITEIFAPMNLKYFVNLCSDDEDDEMQNQKQNNKESIKIKSKAINGNSRHTDFNQKYSKPEVVVDDSEDDLEIVSIDFINKTEKRTKQESSAKTHTSKVCYKAELKMDEKSKDILSKIDKLAADDKKMKSFVHEPNNYTYKETKYTEPKQEEKIVYERRAPASDVLFKRRSDFKDDEVIVQNFENNKEKLYAKRPIEVICLDSGSDGEVSDDSECPSTSNITKLNKTDHVEKTETISNKNKKIIQDTNSNKSRKTENKNNANVEILCNSTGSILLDTNELLDEILPQKGGSVENSTQPICENSSNTTDIPNPNIEQVNKILDISIKSNKIVDVNKENKSQLKCKSNTNTIDALSLNSEQVNEILNIATEANLETLYEAVSCVRQMNTSSPKSKVAESVSALDTELETPPPAPPLNINNLPTPRSPPYYPLQQPMPLGPTFMPSYQNSNVIPKADLTPRPRPKVNPNDPRIKKQLRAIQNSPLSTLNILDADIENNIRKICETQQLQPPQQPQPPQPSQPPQQPQPQQQTIFQTTSAYPSKKNMAPSLKSSNVHKSHINYAEYKRRQLKKKLEMEKQKEEREAKARAIDEDIRCKLLSTLHPCRKLLTTLWSQQKRLKHDSNENKTEQKDQKQNNMQIPKNTEKINNAEANRNKEKKTSLSTKNSIQSENKREEKTVQNINSNIDQRLSRVYNELKCTFKGFDTIQDYIPEKIREKKLSESSTSSQTTEVAVTPRLTGLRRRSSIHALSAITEQLCQQSPDCSDSEVNATDNSKRSISCSSHGSKNLSKDSMCSIPKRRKTSDEIIETTTREKNLRIVSDDSSSSESSKTKKPQVAEKTCIKKRPVVILHRLTNEIIKKHTRSLKAETNNENLACNQSLTIKKTCQRVKSTKEPVQKKSKLKKLNNDCQMTERNTYFCVLCRSKPSDLTNHYIGRHRTESYVARLDWSKIENLAINTPFAKLQPRTKNCRFERYEVVCPFCEEKLVDVFINLYNHYSAHTGEYAFQCSHCHLTKPYRPDIQSHILHSKTCRNSSIQVMYRYPPHAQCIYLYYCTICNFVQLNEANVLKHLRDHHALINANASNVRKCILAAMNDGPDVNETNKSPSPTPISTPTPPPVQKVSAPNSKGLPGEEKELITTVALNTEIHFKVDDDDIPVRNEPCLDNEILEVENSLLEEQLKQLHEGPTTANTLTPMTVVHSMENFSSDLSRSTLPNIYSKTVQKHLPIILKTEAMDIDDKLTMTLPTFSNYKAEERPLIDHAIVKNHTVYQKYRHYPQNVNYLGLYKCMIDDCYYSTDNSEEMYKHLIEHSEDEFKTSEYLQCPYCVLPVDMPMTAKQLVDHVRSQHGHLNYQCCMCCYRSCSASNVRIHQQTHHNSDLSKCTIYKCSNEVLEANNVLEEHIARNIYKISCRICGVGFYHIQLLINHLEKDHKVYNVIDLKVYSCIYCPLTVENISELKIHVATKHPGELPLVYDHNKQIDNTSEDFKSTSNVIDISESVPWIEVKPKVCGESAAENLFQDIKPDLKELLHINEETAKVRLRKFTAHTGIAPDNLYRCPEPTCSGFFSVFDLWLRHMKARHYTSECQCPHCNTEMLLPLNQFKLHFEQHRSHTYICFYCTTTCPTEMLAKQHAAEKHSDLGVMRFENVRFNINYSYSIMIQSDLFKEREEFIAELLTTLDNHLKDLENNENKKFKQQWPVRDNTPWVDDYLQTLSTRKVALRCLVKDCNFRTLKEYNLYRHLSTSHTITGTQFNCSKCDYHVEKCDNLDELFNHIKLHNEYIFICAACSLITSSRSKMSSHIGEQHSARDVPVIHLFRTNQLMYIKIFIVFADNHFTFSTMKNCFCCCEQNMGGDVFSLHLKRYHKLALNYYCENCSNFSFKSLNEVRPHFQTRHNSNKFKIRCELAAHNDLSVTSLNEFKIQILTPDTDAHQLPTFFHIKNEPMDVSDCENVILLEDDDIVIQDSLRDEKKQPVSEVPKLKCTSLSKLIKSPASTPTVPLLINSNLRQLPSSSLPAASAIDKRQIYYNLGPVITNRNVCMQNSYPLNSSALISAQTDSIYSVYNNPTIRADIRAQTESFHIRDRLNIESTQHVPITSHMNQTYIPRSIYSNNTTSMSGICLQTQNNEFFPNQNNNFNS